MKNKTATLYYYQNKELENHIDSNHKSLLIKAEKTAKEQSSQNFPPPKSKHSRPFIGEISENYQGLIHESKTRLQSDIHSAELEAKDEGFILKQEEIQKEIEATENLIRLKTSELAGVDKSKIKKAERWKKVKIFNIIIVATDTVLCSSVFENLQFNFLTSTIIGICLGFSILMVAENLRKIASTVNTKFQKRLILFGVFSCLFGIFYVMGMYRAENIKEAEGVVTSPLFFASLQLFFLSVASVASYFSKPTVEEFKIMDAYKIVKDELSELESKKASLQGEKETNIQQQKEKEDSRRRIIQYAKDMELKINSKYLEAFQKYTSTNVFTRSDSKVPLFFNHLPEPLTLYYQN